MTHLIGTSVDITARKEAEKRQEQSRRELQEVLENSPVAIAISIEGRVAMVNPRFVSIIGAEVGDIAADYYVNPHDRDKHLERLRAGETLENVEVQLYNKDREIRDVLISFLTTTYEGKEGYLAWIVDITERKQLERELLEAKETAEILSRDFTNFLDSTADLVYLKDNDLRYRACSRELALLLGYSDWHEIIGKTDEQIRRPSTLIHFEQEPELEVLEQGSSLSLTENIIVRGDRKGILSTIKKPLLNSRGEAVGVLSISRDITEITDMAEELRQALEKAEEATRAKSEFLANMSHEIRTPMNAVIGMTHLALRTDLDRKQRDYLEKIDGSAKALLRIINDILDFSKIEAGGLELETTEFHLDSVIENLSNMLLVQVEEKGLELLFRVDPEVPLNLVGDPLRLGQILLNLVSNAIKFTEQGEIVVSICTKERIGNQILLKFSVKDSGIGLTTAQQRKLFRSFSQADASTTRRFGGTGLGLAISKELAAMMGGEIGVESELTQGSTFWFTVKMEEHQKELRSPLRLAEDFSNMKVLVVDDNRGVHQPGKFISRYF